MCGIVYFSQVFSSTIQEAQNAVALAALGAIAQGEFCLLTSVVNCRKLTRPFSACRRPGEGVFSWFDWTLTSRSICQATYRSSKSSYRASFPHWQPCEDTIWQTGETRLCSVLKPWSATKQPPCVNSIVFHSVHIHAWNTSTL